MSSYTAVHISAFYDIIVLPIPIEITYQKELSLYGFWRVITEHEPVYNMEEAGRLELPYPESDAKNLFVRDDKKRNYYLISVKGDRRVDLKEFRARHGTRSLSFASDADLFKYLGVEPGAVTPLGLLNDKDCAVKLSTVCMKTADLISLLRERGTEVEITDF